jgi:uncharacterized protein
METYHPVQNQQVDQKRELIHGPAADAASHPGGRHGVPRQDVRLSAFCYFGGGGFVIYSPGFRKGPFSVPIVEQVDRDLLAAMKAQDELKRSVLRMMKAALKNKQIELGKALDDAQATAVLKTLVKQRHDSVEQFRKGGREELARREEAEIIILSAYLPAAAGDEEMSAAVEAALAETGAAGPQDVGKVMKAAMARLAGKNADGKLVSAKVKAKLGA